LTDRTLFFLTPEARRAGFAAARNKLEDELPGDRG